MPGMNESAGGLGLLERTELEVSPDSPWNTLVHNDPINTFPYVIATFLKILKCGKEKASALTSQVHYEGKAVVFSGTKEQAELYAAQFSAAHLWSSVQKASS